MSDSLWPHEPQHTRPPCPLPTPGVYSNTCPSSWWCHPAISSSVIPFSSCPQSLLASGAFPVSQLFAWGGQSTGVSALASVLPVNTQDWSPSGWTGWISLQSKGKSILYSGVLNFCLMSFFSSRVTSRTPHCICFCISLGSFLLWHFLRISFFFSFNFLTVSRGTGQLFCWISFSWDLPDVFLMIRLGLWVLGRKITEVKCHSHHTESRYCQHVSWLLTLTLTLWLR